MVKQAFALLLICAATCAIGDPGPAATSQPAVKHFFIRMLMTEMKDGKVRTLAEPMLVAKESQPASFLAGGELPVELDGIEHIQFGTQAKVIVHELSDGQLRVSAAFSVSDVEKTPDGAIIIPERGVRVIKTIRPGEAIEADLPDGRHVSMKIKTATPARADDR